MTRWEYHVLFLAAAREIGQVEDALNQLGRDGWELVTVDDAGENAKVFFFKRPIQ